MNKLVVVVSRPNKKKCQFVSCNPTDPGKWSPICLYIYLKQNLSLYRVFAILRGSNMFVKFGSFIKRTYDHFEEEIKNNLKLDPKKP